MTIPKYIAELLDRSEYDYRYYTSHDEYSVGYTINIYKSTCRTYIDTLKAEIDRLQKWVARNGGEMHILHIPKDTLYINQFATVTIYDPLMKYLESHIQNNSYDGHLIPRK